MGKVTRPLQPGAPSGKRGLTTSSPSAPLPPGCYLVDIHGNYLVDIHGNYLTCAPAIPDGSFMSDSGVYYLTEEGFYIVGG